jgi:hypothetical protein
MSDYPPVEREKCSQITALTGIDFGNCGRDAVGRDLDGNPLCRRHLDAWIATQAASVPDAPPDE